MAACAGVTSRGMRWAFTASAYSRCGDSVRGNGGEPAFGDLREGLAFGGLHDFGFHFSIETAFQADEAPGEGFNRRHFGRAQRGGIEELVKADGRSEEHT